MPNAQCRDGAGRRCGGLHGGHRRRRRLPGTGAEPLREDPEVAAQNGGAAEEPRRGHRAAQSMTRAQVDTLESALRSNPTDFDGWRQLKTFCRSSGQKVFGWDEMVRAGARTCCGSSTITLRKTWP